MSKKCLGCGSILQSLNNSEPGYVKNIDFKYCERCFRVTNYSENKEQKLEYSNDKIINEINHKADLCVFLVDFLTLNKEIIKIFKTIESDKVLVLNKSDLIPNNIKEEKIISFLEDNYQIINKVLIVSSINKHNIPELKNIIEKYQNIYFAGFTNSGKSSLINLLFKEYDNRLSKITTSIMPNTTLDFISLNYKGKLFVDCPGFNYQNDLINNDIKIVKKVNSNKKVKPITYQIKENDTINIDDYCLINCDKNNSITLYMSNDFKIKKVYGVEFEGSLLNVPSNTDLILKSIGFINFKKACTIKLSIPTSLIEKRDSIFR